MIVIDFYNYTYVSKTVKCLGQYNYYIIYRYAYFYCFWNILYSINYLYNIELYKSFSSMNLSILKYNSIHRFIIYILKFGNECSTASWFMDVHLLCNRISIAIRVYLHNITIVILYFYHFYYLAIAPYQRCFFHL